MENMSDTDTPRSIRFPKALWDAIDQDAKRCKRSSSKQMEALLTAYFELEGVELDKNRLELVQQQTNGKKEPVGKPIKPKEPVAEKLNFSAKKPSRKRQSNEEALNAEIDRAIAKKESQKNKK